MRNRIFSFSYLFFSSIFLAGCGTSSENNLPYPQQADSTYQTIAIMGTNDMHGALLPNGPYLSSYKEVLKSQWRDDFIWLDAGDEFQGSLESNFFYGASVVDFFNYEQLNAAAVGNHEFDFGFEKLNDRFKQAHYPYLASNISPEFGAKKNTILDVDGTKIGIIGLSTLQTPITTATNVSRIQFENLAKSTIVESSNLKAKGADIVLVVAHVGAECVDKNAVIKTALYKKSDIQSQCQSDDELVRYLNQLPKNTIDGVVSGHTHSIIHHWINGVPVIQSGAFGKYFSVMYLTFNKISKKVEADQTMIEGPVSIDKGTEQKPAFFHGSEIKEDPKINEILAPYLEKIEKLKSEKITIVENPVTRDYSGESSFGNLVTDVILKESGADVAIFNAGGIRANWEPGTLTYGDVFKAFPFDNLIVTAELSGSDLIKLMQIIQSGKKGFYATARLHQIVTLNPNKLVDVTFSDGTKIDPSKTYKIVTNDFLINGGDDFSQAIQVVNFKNKHLGPSVRDVLLDSLRKMKSVNTSENPLIDKAHPRVEIQVSP